MTATPRSDGRSDDELRPVTLTRHWLDHAAGSVLVEFGRTRVLCVASASEGVPRWRKGSGLGWVTAEYAMLPGSTNTRTDRESVRGRIGGRTHEISRLVGRSLRAVIDYKALGENTIVLDCDVLQADGGTRTAAITGAYVALADAVSHLRSAGALTGEPLTGSVAAVSVGIVDGVPRLDLHYDDDVRAETDMNVVMTGDGKYVEVQGTAEGAPFDRAELDALLALAERGCADLTKLQLEALATRARSVKLFLATRNAGKLAEMQRILAAHAADVEVVGLDAVAPYDEPVEDRPTFEGNALLKARAGLAATGLPSVADDSGLCVDALNGMPGVLSARWSGPPLSDKRGADLRNNELLLAQLADVPDDRRGAHFVCAVAFCHPDGTEAVVRGEMRGRVVREARGSGGFGYDVVFEADDAPGVTTAELTPADKDAISHRGKALREIGPLIAASLRRPAARASRQIVKTWKAT